jgi:ABC-type methionine transport system ATPase subunit
VSRIRFHLTFPEHLVQEPVIWRLGREFGVVTNIRRASIEERFGWVILEMEGTEGHIARAVAWLADQGIQVDRIDEDRETT